jgi:hypothetical protein
VSTPPADRLEPGRPGPGLPRLLRRRLSRADPAQPSGAVLRLTGARPREKGNSGGPGWLREFLAADSENQDGRAEPRQGSRRDRSSGSCGGGLRCRGHGGCPAASATGHSCLSRERRYDSGRRRIRCGGRPAGVLCRRPDSHRRRGAGRCGPFLTGAAAHELQQRAMGSGFPSPEHQLRTGSTP